MYSLRRHYQLGHNLYLVSQQEQLSLKYWMKFLNCETKILKICKMLYFHYFDSLSTFSLVFFYLRFFSSFNPKANILSVDDFPAQNEATSTTIIIRLNFRLIEGANCTLLRRRMVD